MEPGESLCNWTLIQSNSMCCVQKKWVVHAVCKEEGRDEEFQKRTAAVRMQEAALKREHIQREGESGLPVCLVGL